MSQNYGHWYCKSRINLLYFSNRKKNVQSFAGKNLVDEQKQKKKTETY